MKDATPRLGRGLAALLGEAARPATAADAVGMVATELLDPSPYQPRGAILDAELQELAASIRAQGVLQPILVRRAPAQPGRFQIIAGERRWRAAKLAGVATVPCFVREMADSEASAAALVENLQRKDLNPIEEAEGLRRLLDEFGLTQEALGAAIGKSRSYVANALRLLGLPASVLAHVRDGRLSAGHARAALACADPAGAAEQMIVQGLNVRQAEQLASPKPPPPERPSRPVAADERSADLRAVEASLGEHLGMRVTISFNGRGGSIALQYQTLDQLDFIVARLGSHTGDIGD